MLRIRPSATHARPPGAAVAGGVDRGEGDGEEEEEAEAGMELGRMLLDFLDPDRPKVGLVGMYLPLALAERHRRVDVSMFYLEFFSLISGLLIFVVQGLKGGFDVKEGTAARVTVVLADLATVTYFMVLIMAFQIAFLVINGTNHGNLAFVLYFTTTIGLPFLLFFVSTCSGRAGRGRGLTKNQKLSNFLLLAAEIARYFTYEDAVGTWVLVGWVIVLFGIVEVSTCSAAPGGAED